jgi:hypothetical protein
VRNLKHDITFRDHKAKGPGPHSSTVRVDITEFDTVEEALKTLGEVKMLDYINYAHRLNQLRIERAKYTK